MRFRTSFLSSASARALKWILAASLSAAIAACGGGEPAASSGASPVVSAAKPQQDNSWLTFTPNPVMVDAVVGEASHLLVRTQSSTGPSSKPLYMTVTDPRGLFVINSVSGPTTSFQYGIDLSTSTTTPVGNYTGTLVVTLCSDTDCRKPYSGSPWSVAYQVKVSTYAGFKPLAGAPAWTTFQGNAAHTGFVPATVSPVNFKHRWTSATPGSAVAAELDLVYSVRKDAAGWHLDAKSEIDGTAKWTYSFGETFRVNPPALSNGRVFVTTTGHQETAMWAFDAFTGARLARVPLASQWETYLSPTPYKGKVYTESGTYGGMAAFDAATATQLWWTSLPQYDTWTPAVDDRFAYAYTGVGGSTGALTMIGPDGTVTATITDPAYEWAGYSMRGSPVLGENGMVFATQFGSSTSLGFRGRLLGFDVNAGTLKWSLAAYYRSNPVIANGVLFAVNQSVLEARVPATGELLWTWAPPEGFSAQWDVSNPIIVVGNTAFVGTASKTHAIDLTTRASVWNYPATGPLAVSSNGILYIAPTASGVVAIDLH